MNEFEIIESMKTKDHEEDFVNFVSQFRSTDGDEVSQVKFDDFVLSHKSSSQCYVNLDGDGLKTKDLFYIPVVIVKDGFAVDFNEVKKYVLSGYAQDFENALVEIENKLHPISDLPLYNYQQKEILNRNFDSSTESVKCQKGVYYVVGSIMFDPEEEDFPSSSISDHDKAILNGKFPTTIDGMGVLGCYDLVTTALLASNIYNQAQLLSSKNSNDIYEIFYGESSVTIKYHNDSDTEIKLLPRESYVENCEINYEMDTLRTLLQ